MGNWGVGFIMGRWEIFKVSLHSWQRGANPLILWKLPYIAYTSFFKCCQAPHPSPPPHKLPCHLQSPPPLFFLLSCFFSGMGDHTTFDDTYNLGQIHLISHTNKHKNTHTAHSGTSRLTYPYKYIFTPPFICSQQLPLLH